MKSSVIWSPNIARRREMSATKASGVPMGAIFSGVGVSDCTKSLISVPLPEPILTGPVAPDSAMSANRRAASSALSISRRDSAP